MKQALSIFMILTLFSLTYAADYKEIFNQKDFTGWYGKNPHRHKKLNAEKSLALSKQEQIDLHKHWKVENGIIVNDGHGPYLTTKKDYENIILELEVKLEKKSDSGIYLRGLPQVQLWDTKDESKWKHGAKLGSGGLWNNKVHTDAKDPLVHADNPTGEWNKVKIIQVGARTSAWINNKLVVDHQIMDHYGDYSKPLPKKGPVMLQTHGAPVYWKNIKIKELSNEESVTYLMNKAGADSWKNITPTATMDSNWKSTVQKPFEYIDGAIRGGKGHYYYAAEELSNYKMSFKFKLNEGANNGLLVRYPGKGNTAYHGNCELQILDNRAEKYAKLDDRQYHGSAYGMKAAHRGYLNPIDEWNHQIVTVNGSNITVELNGYEILNVNLKEVKEFMGNKEHPGLDREKGYIGFAGHNPPYVDFKDIHIKKLN